MTAFTRETEALAAAAGYSLAFAFHGGWNRGGAIVPTHLHRISPAEDPGMLRMEASFLRMGLLMSK
jgi:hypothetical protein